MTEKANAKREQRLEKTFSYIMSCIMDRGYPPTTRDICRNVGTASTSTVNSDLRELSARGLISTERYKPRTIKVTGEMEKSSSLKSGEENKQHICDLLLPALQATRQLHDLMDLKFDSEKKTVTALFDNGFEKTAHIAGDSGIAIIKDILKQIV